MTTALVKPLAREVLVSGTAYRVTIAADRLTLKAKGKRTNAIDITWDELLTRRQHDVETPPVTRSPSHPPRSVLTDVAQDLRTAAASLAKADASLVQAGALPSELRAEAAGDPVYGRGRAGVRLVYRAAAHRTRGGQCAAHLHTRGKAPRAALDCPGGRGAVSAVGNQGVPAQTGVECP